MDAKGARRTRPPGGGPDDTVQSRGPHPLATVRMHCPFCGDEDTRVIDSRLVAEGGEVRRRRACQGCGERFTTYERPALVMPHVVKSNGAREPFNEEKLRAGMLRALEKRPVGAEAIENAIGHITHVLRSTGEREVPSRTVGEAVMEELRAMDAVAYVRFASVYRDFQDIRDFSEEVRRLSPEND